MDSLDSDATAVLHELERCCAAADPIPHHRHSSRSADLGADVRRITAAMKQDAVQIPAAGGAPPACRAPPMARAALHARLLTLGVCFQWPSWRTAWTSSPRSLKVLYAA